MPARATNQKTRKIIEEQIQSLGLKSDINEFQKKQGIKDDFSMLAIKLRLEYEEVKNIESVR